MSKNVSYYQQTLQFTTPGRGTTEITQNIRAVVRTAEINMGVCHAFIHHTSASLMICENADEDVRVDLESFMQKIVPDGDPIFIHTCEGADDMPAHVRSVMTQTELTLPITQGELALGIWQGVYLWEHRHRGHQRKITLTIHGCVN
ncbi:MAG: secondary thiamine-phosphate synthase enzyme YjbQ [Gammaproteobacteria bacterium]